MRLAQLGDRTILITLGDSVTPAVHRDVRRALGALRRAALAGVRDIVPGFASVAVHYDPAVVDASGSSMPCDSLSAAIEKCLAMSSDESDGTSTLVEIPVLYGGPSGPDLESLAATHAITPDEVVRLHSEREYMVYMLGFMPGFAYLGGLAPELVTPRRSEPRTHVPAGSVGIGGEQTGVYPLESPGGWHLIGKTPVRMFRPEQDPPTLLAMGDRVRFRPVSDRRFKELESAGE